MCCDWCYNQQFLVRNTLVGLRIYGSCYLYRHHSLCHQAHRHQALVLALSSIYLYRQLVQHLFQVCFKRLSVSLFCILVFTHQFCPFVFTQFIRTYAISSPQQCVPFSYIFCQTATGFGVGSQLVAV